MATIGYTSIGASDWALSAFSFDNPTGLKITLTEDTTLNSIYAAVKYATTTASLTASIYADSSGTRGSLLHTSNSQNASSTSYSWQEFTFASDPELIVGTYWLQIGAASGISGTRSIAYDTGGGSNSSYYVNDIGTLVYGTSRWSVYLNYTPVAAPASVTGLSSLTGVSSITFT